MNYIDINRICIHECCHAVVARLFRERMAIEGIFVNRDLVQQGRDQGALNLRGPTLKDEHDFTALAITYLAGVVGENMYLMGVDTIKEKKEEIIADNKVIDWSMTGGDSPSFEHVASFFSLLYMAEGAKLKEFCLRFLITFLSVKEVWFFVEQLCFELLKKEDLKMSEEELESVFMQIGLDEFLDNNRKHYLKKLDDVLQFCQGSENCL